MNVMQAQGSNQLPAQIIVNQKGPNVSAIYLRFRKSVEAVELASPPPKKKVVEHISDSEVVTEKEFVPPIPFP